MKIFQIIRTNLKILGISSKQSTQSFPFNSKILTGFLIAGLSMTSAFVYLFCVATTFMEYAQCIITTSAGICVSVCFGTLVFQMSKIFENIDIIEKTIEIRSKFPTSNAIYDKVNQQIEKLSEIVFIVVMKILLQCAMLPISIGSIIVYVTTDLGSDSFVLPMPIWIPFDTKIPIGYLFGVCLQYIFVGCAGFVSACSISFGIGSYFIQIAEIKDIKGILHSINKWARNKRKRLNISKQVREYMHLHSILKQITRTFSDIVQPNFIVIFTWAMAAICAGMLTIQMKTVTFILHHEMSYLTLLLELSESFYAFVVLFIACDLGQRSSDKWNEIRLMIGQFHWYLFPNELKRMLPTIIVIAQQPVEVQFFGSFSLSREMFKKIVNKAFSYFMVLRQFIK